MKKRGQVWIETVIYTLIGLAIIGIVLSLVKPAIDAKKDQILLGNSLSMLNTIDEQIEDIRYYGAGNSRSIEISIKKGMLEFNSLEDKVVFSMNSKYMFSEIGENVSIGKITALTIKKTNTYDIILSLSYKNSINLTWQDKEMSKVFQAAAAPYNLQIINKGKIGNFTQIDVS
mgnify:FL=1